MRYIEDLSTAARIVPAEEVEALAAFAPVQPEHSDFELPRWMWEACLPAMRLFSEGLLGATAGSARAEFAVAVSAFYIVMFFGTARLLANVDGRKVGPFTRTGSNLNTCYGPMDIRSVAGQVLVLPTVLGFFGVAIAVIAAILT